MHHKKRMRRVEKIFIAAGLAVIVLISCGFYVNYQLDHLVKSLNQPGLLFADSTESGIGNQGGSSNSYVSGSSEHSTRTSGQISGSSQDESPGQKNTSETPSNKSIASGVQSKISKPIEKGDMIKAGLIILRKLNSDEISYLYSVGNKDSHTPEEREKVRAILLTKLNNEDIQTLKSLGDKYGKDLQVLDQ